MITKEAIEAALNAYYGNDVEHGWMAREQMESAITAAFAAMPGPVVKVSREDIRAYERGECCRAEITPATDLASENERLRAALEFVTLWAWREDPPNANRKLTDEERLSAIKYHPSIRPSRAALERT